MFNNNCADEIEPELKDIHECWIGGGSLYPLCKGNGKEKCLQCPIYEKENM